MKIRNGFVSNSSSSSFVLIGKQVNIMDISEKDIVEKIYICVGKELGDGEDIFYIENIEMLWFLKAAKKINFQLEYFSGFKIYESHKSEYVSEDEIRFNSKNLPKGELSAINCYKDYNSTEDVEDLFDKYAYIDDDLKIAYQREQRKQKLKNIKNV